MLQRMETNAFDVIIIGAGIAGATVAAAVAADRRVALVEAEEAAGYHSTGRSAAMWMHNYGPPDVRRLTGLSRGFFVDPPPGFTDVPLLNRRSVLYLAPPEQLEALDNFLAHGVGSLHAISVAEAHAMIPALRPDYAAGAAMEEDTFDMDVAALHQGFLRQLRSRGGVLSLRSRTDAIARSGGLWQVQTKAGAFAAPILVDCAGAWGDEVATQAGVTPLGLTPKRRTGLVIDPAPWEPANWPMTNDVAHTWYCRPEARTKLMVSPADETDMTPHDVQPDELDVAIAVDRMQQALDIDVRRVEHSWAGLRTFTPDRSLAFGWDARAEGFFWVVGQGGYGIQTSPAAGRFVADTIAGRPLDWLGDDAATAFLPVVDPARFAAKTPPSGV
jgi:D-arginine dehydrogenase